jgi:hypothetical protein
VPIEVPASETADASSIVEASLPVLDPDAPPVLDPPPAEVPPVPVPVDPPAVPPAPLVDSLPFPAALSLGFWLLSSDAALHPTAALEATIRTRREALRILIFRDGRANLAGPSCVGTAVNAHPRAKATGLTFPTSSVKYIHMSFIGCIAIVVLMEVAV